MSNESPIVLTKDENQKQFTLPLGSYLGVGETLTSVTLSTISPTTSPAITASALAVSSTTSATITLNSGISGTTYGIRINALTSLSRPFTFTIAVLVQVDLNVPYATKDAFAFQTLVGSIEVGDAAVGKAFFILPADVDASQGYVAWDVVDRRGVVYAAGNCYDYRVAPGSISTTVEACGLINIPSTVPPTLESQSYQLRWSLLFQDGSANQHSYENLTITGFTSVPIGAQETVEMAGDNIQLAVVIERAFPVVSVSVFKDNTAISADIPVTEKSRVASGWFYHTYLDTSSIIPSLDPYSVSWKYHDIPPLQIQRRTARLFLVNPSILTAIEDVRQSINKARTTLMGFEDMLFDDVTVLSALRRGRDKFNAAAGFITDFNMTNAKGPIREGWLKFSEAELLRSQYLAEGEKAFDFQGQAISLNVDRTQIYSSMADSIESELDKWVPTFKKNLQIKGILGGDGNTNGLTSALGALGGVGININAVSPNYPNHRVIWR